MCDFEGAESDNHLLRVYLHEVIYQCDCCIADTRRLNQAIEDGSDVFDPLEDLIRHAASVSRIIWPSARYDRNGRKKARRKGLAKLLGIDDQHPVADKTVRDHLDHFDERIDAWAESSRNRNVVNRYVGPPGTVTGDALDDSDFLRHYDPAASRLIIRGDPFDIQDLVSGVEDIRDRASKAMTEICPGVGSAQGR